MTPEKIMNESTTPEAFRGFVRVCTPDDQPALFDLYRAVYPKAELAEVAAYVKAEHSSAWVTYRNEQGDILVAVFVRSDGAVLPLVNPAESRSLEIREGFLAAMREARAALAQRGISDITVIYAPCLEPLMKSLEKFGFLGHPAAIARMLRFDQAGDIARVQ